MSQAGELSISGSVLPPQVPTTFVEDTGTATPAANILDILGGNNIHTDGSGNTVTINVSGTTDHSLQLGNSTGSLTSLGIATDGQLPIGSTGLDPVLANLTAGANIVITNQPGGIVISSPGGGGPATGVQMLTGNVGAASAVANNINVLGSTGITTTGSGSTLTIALNTSVVGQSITGDSGGALSPTAGNWNIFGEQASSIPVMDTIGSGSTLSIENRVWLTSLVVDPSSTAGTRGTFSTIASAITAASSGQDIFIRPGTYTEDLTLKAGVNLTAFAGDELTPNVTIIGKCSFSGAGTVTISNIRLQTNSDNFLNVTGSSASIVNIESCYLNCTNNTGISFTTSNSGAILSLSRCYGDLGTTGISLYSMSSTGTLLSRYSYFTNTGGSSTTNTNSDGKVEAWYTRFENSITTNTNGQLQFRYCRVNSGSTSPDTVSVTHNATGGSSSGSVLLQCIFVPGTVAGISVGAGAVLKLVNCSIETTTTNAVTGAGEIQYVGLSFPKSGVAINTTTQTPEACGPRILLSGGCQLLSGSGSPSGSVTAPKGSLWLRTDGSSTSTRFYINTNGGTIWTAGTTVA